MQQINIDLEAKTLKRVNEEFINNFKPYLHQYQTLNLFKQINGEHSSVALFNYTSTGGGKTLASFAPNLLFDIPTIGVYGTNELITDQRHALNEFMEDSTRLHKIDSNKLNQLKRRFPDFNYNIEFLSGIFGQWADIVLTNPDIFYQIMFGIYENPQNYSAEEVFRTIIKRFPVIIFDEFHLYNIKQVGNVAWMVGLLDKLAPRQEKIFIFSSATPNQHFLKQLDAMDIPYKELPLESDNSLEYFDEKVIMEKVNLTLLPADLARWQALSAIKDNFNLIDDYLEEYPAAKGVFILDSVGDACHLAEKLQDRYEIDIGEVHGFMSKIGRRQGLSQKITVGTTTIEVGIDFKGPRHKNFMVFEAKSASQFLQRLGRLGRGGKTKEKLTIPNRAIAIVPNYVYNFFENNIGVDINLSRNEIEEILNTVYYSYEDFEPYLNKYAPIESFYSRNWIIRQNADDTAKKEKKITKNLLLNLYSCGSVKQLYERYLELEQKNVLKGLLGFRGGGNVFKSEFNPEEQIDFTAAIFDNRDSRDKFPFTFYNLLWVLRKSEFKLLTKNKFKSKIAKNKDRFPQYIDNYKNQLNKKDPDFFLEIDRFKEEKRRLSFSLPINRPRKEIFDTNDLKLVIEKGEKPGALTTINDILKKKRIVAYIAEKNSYSLAKSKNLPPLFQVYSLTFRAPDGRKINKEASIAFNINAFLLESLDQENDETALLI